MNPLPVLDPIAPTASVFDPQQDDLLALIQPEQSAFEQFVASLQQQQNAAGGALTGIGARIDEADAAITAIGQIFDALAAEQRAVDLSGVIIDVLATETQLDHQIDNFNPDVENAGAPLLTAIVNTIAASVADAVQFLINVISSVASALESALADVVNFVMSLIGL